MYRASSLLRNGARGCQNPSSYEHRAEAGPLRLGTGPVSPCLSSARMHGRVHDHYESRPLVKPCVKSLTPSLSHCLVSAVVSSARAGSPCVNGRSLVAQSVYLVGFAYLILSFPSGRLETGLERLLIGCAIALVTFVELASLLFANSRSVLCSDCPETCSRSSGTMGSRTGSRRRSASAGSRSRSSRSRCSITRSRAASPPRRRNVAPVLWAGGVTFAALVVSVADDVGGEPLGRAPKRVLFVAVATLPVAVLIVLCAAVVGTRRGRRTGRRSGGAWRRSRSQAGASRALSDLWLDPRIGFPPRHAMSTAMAGRWCGWRSRARSPRR